MRFVIFSDIQYNAWSEFSKTLPNGLNSRFQDQLNVQEEIFEFAKQQKDEPVILIHTGDLFETMTEKIDKQIFLTVYERFVQFSKENIPVILIPGNHDWTDKTETSSIIEPFKEIENVIVIDQEWKIEFLENLALAFIPYTRKNFLEKVNYVKKQVKGIEHKYLFTHQGVSGAMVGPYDLSLKDEYSITDFGVDTFDIIFNGHYHKAQSVGNIFRIVGSPIQRDFGEREDVKGFLFLDTKANPKKPKFIKTNAPRFFKIVGKEPLPEDLTEKDFLWVVSSKKRILPPNLANVRLDIEEDKQQKVIRTDISINMPLKEQFQKAIRYMLEQNSLNLDETRLIEMTVEKYKESLEKR